jgi:hypothetical protein
MRIRERYDLAVELGWSYQNARRKERSRILDAYCLATGYSRKHGLRVLRGTQQRRRFRVRGVRRRRYGLEFQNALKVLWEASGYVCAERLQPFLRPLASLLAMNRRLLNWCRDEGIQISRSRPFHKNDNAHVEQKNWTLVRRLIGYQRLDTPRQLSWLDDFYTELLRPYNNCFQPVMKLVAKEHRADGQLRKRYDTPTTPLQRVLASGCADLTKMKALVELYSFVSPLTLKRQIDIRLAAMPLSRRLAANA